MKIKEDDKFVIGALIVVLALIVILIRHYNKDNSTEINVKASSTDNVTPLEEQRISIADSLKIDSLEKDKSKKIDEILKPFKKKYDEVEDVSFYLPVNIGDSRNDIYMYLVRNKNEVYARLFIQYYAEDWIFVENWTLKTENEKRTIIPTADIKRDNGSQHVWETCDMLMEGYLEAVPLQIIGSKKATLRFNGSDYYKDMAITNTQRKNISDIWNARFQINKLNGK